MTWFKGVNDISPLQLRMVDMVVDKIESTPQGGAFWVQGAAGTGKTIVLCHIVRRLEAARHGLSVVFLTYTHALKGMIEQAVRDSGSDAPVSTYLSFLKGAGHFDVILLDEVQDVESSHLEALRRRCRHLIIAGDCEQRIYDSGMDEGVIDATIHCEKRRLLELFRITKFIVKAARAILPDTVLVEGDVKKIRDANASVTRFSDPQKEARWAFEEALAMARPKYPAVILLPHHGAILAFCRNLATDLDIASTGPHIQIEKGKIQNYDQLNAHFAHHDVPVRYFGNSFGSLTDANERPLVFIMTYHSSKGLDFDVVHMPGLSSDIEIMRFTPRMLDKDTLERRLFFVAMTRSRERLLMSYSGQTPHELVNALPHDAVAFGDYREPDFEEEDDLF